MRTSRHLIAALVLAGILVLGGVYLLSSTISPSAEAYDRTTVTVLEANERINVRVADTPQKRFVGLSATDSLEVGEGMLFVHGEETEHTYVMREMDFPIDIIFIDSDGRITSIHHAEVPENRLSRSTYTGYGTYVLEVPMGYTNESGISPGDRVEIDEY